MVERYGELYHYIEDFPAKPPVDVEHILKEYVASYIFQLQQQVAAQPHLAQNDITTYFQTSETKLGSLIHLIKFERGKNNEFKAVLKIVGSPLRLVDVTHNTNAGMQGFEFRYETNNSPLGSE